MRHAAPFVLSASLGLASALCGGCDTSSSYSGNLGYSPTTAPVVSRTPTSYCQTAAIRPVTGYTPAPAPRPTLATSTRSVTYANDATFDRELGSSSVPVIINFTAKWCGPCKAMTPTVDSLAAEQAGHVRVIRVDFDESPGIVRRYNVSALPAILMVRNGVVVKRIVGYQSRESLATAVATALP